jgi:hypothetical protein
MYNRLQGFNWCFHPNLATVAMAALDVAYMQSVCFLQPSIGRFSKHSVNPQIKMKQSLHFVLLCDTLAEK